MIKISVLTVLYGGAITASALLLPRSPNLMYWIIASWVVAIIMTIIFYYRDIINYYKNDKIYKSQEEQSIHREVIDKILNPLIHSDKGIEYVKQETLVEYKYYYGLDTLIYEFKNNSPIFLDDPWNWKTIEKENKGLIATSLPKNIKAEIEQFDKEYRSGNKNIEQAVLLKNYLNKCSEDYIFYKEQHNVIRSS